MTNLENLLPLAEQVISACKKNNLMVSTAESCTGGMIAGLLTEVPGASAVLDCGFVTYSNEAKRDLLDVSPADLAKHGAVSEPVAKDLAQGALIRSRADIAVSVTGIAGPDGGSDEKPVGTVYFGLARTGLQPICKHCLFPNEGRDAIRAISIQTALELVRDAALSEMSQ